MQWHSTATAEKPRKQPRRQHHNSGAMLNASEVQSQDNKFASHLLELNGPCGSLRPEVPLHFILSSGSWTASNTVLPHQSIISSDHLLINLLRDRSPLSIHCHSSSRVSRAQFRHLTWRAIDHFGDRVFSASWLHRCRQRWVHRTTTKYPLLNAADIHVNSTVLESTEMDSMLKFTVTTPQPLRRPLNISWWVSSAPDPRASSSSTCTDHHIHQSLRCSFSTSSPTSSAI